MNLVIRSFLLTAIACGILARPAPNELDIRAQYLYRLLDSAKARTKVNGELNFLAEKEKVSNIVQSIAGIRVTENDEFQFEVGLPPAQDTQTMKGLSVVIHSSANNSIVRGQVIRLLVTCKNSTAVHLVSSYTPTEADETAEWLELSMNTTNFTCPSLEECKVFIQVGEASSVDALLPLLVVYRYSIDGGFEDSVSLTVQKRAADNITSLSELRGNPCNCSLHSTFLLYATELRIFTETQQVIAPNRNGVDFTYCYGECNRLSAPKSLTIAERVNFLRQGNANIPRPSCVPDQIVDDELLIHSLDDKIVQLQTFPRITSCKCVI